MSEKCKDCGAEVRFPRVTSGGQPGITYACGRDKGGPPTVPCLERQLAQAVEAKGKADADLCILRADRADLDAFVSQRYPELNYEQNPVRLAIRALELVATACEVNRLAALSLAKERDDANERRGETVAMCQQLTDELAAARAACAAMGLAMASARDVLSDGDGTWNVHASVSRRAWELLAVKVDNA